MRSWDEGPGVFVAEGMTALRLITEGRSRSLEQFWELFVCG
ncbi:MAG: hypothetical protein ACFBSG_12315 [Leptolyngbyaceae cyanobacterium]